MQPDRSVGLFSVDKKTSGKGKTKEKKNDLSESQTVARFKELGL